MRRIIIENGSQIPHKFGPLRAARKKSLVQIREPSAPSEHFKKSWGDLTAIPGQDYVLFSSRDHDGYPCKIDIFRETYEETEPGSGFYQKTERSRLVQVPPGVVAVLKTKEGDLEVEYPDYIVVGPRDEVYANRPTWVEENLEFVD